MKITKEEIIKQKLRLKHLPISFKTGGHKSKRNKPFRKRKHKNKEYE